MVIEIHKILIKHVDFLVNRSFCGCFHLHDSWRSVRIYHMQYATFKTTLKQLYEHITEQNIVKYLHTPSPKSITNPPQENPYA